MTAVIIYITCWSCIHCATGDMTGWQIISSNAQEALERGDRYEQVVMRAVVEKPGSLNLPKACDLVTLDSVSGI